MELDKYDKDAYFELRDKLIKRLPDPERSVYGYFRQLEKSNMQNHGRLVVNGKTPIEMTAHYFMLEVAETKQLCLKATRQLTELMKDY